MDPRLFHNARASFFARNQTAFLTSGGLHSLFLASIPQIVQAHGTVTTLINGLLYTFSLTNVQVCNSGITPSDCFRHALTYRVPVVADFQLNVVPLLADKTTTSPIVLSKVRSVVCYQPICTGRTVLTTAATQDPNILNQTLPDGIFICRGRMRTIPCSKTMFNNMILLMEKKKFFRLQVRSSHDGDRSLEQGNPFRSTSSIEFEIAKKKLKRTVSDGVIKCRLPFSKHEVHIAVLAQAFGCEPQQLVRLVQAIAGDAYDAAIFRAYETSIMYDKSVQDMQEHSMRNVISAQDAATLMLSKLSDKSVLSTGVNLLKTEVFPHLNVMYESNNKDKLYFAKVFYLALCTTRLILFASRKLSETSRDLWQFANMQMPAFQLGTVFRQRFIKHMGMFSKLLRRELLRILKKPPEKQHHLNLIKLFGEPRLTWRIDTAIVTGTITKKKVGVTLALNDNNQDAIWTQLLRTKSSMSTTDSVNTNPRKVQKDGFGYGCAASTSDGEAVGLQNELACTVTITVELDDPCGMAELVELILKPFLKDILEFLQISIASTAAAPACFVAEEEKKMFKRSEASELLHSLDFTKLKRNWYLFINNCGIPTHFVAAEDVVPLVNMFRTLRREGTIYKHAFIAVTHNPRQIRILCEGGQVARPLIVLENLHRAKPDMTFQDMVHMGIIEWVTPAEEQTLCKVAMCVEDIQHAISKNEHKELTHLEFTQAAFVGFLAATVVYLTGQQGPRLALYEHQKKQVMTAEPKIYRGSVMSTESWYAHMDLVYTEIASMIHGAKDGRGIPCVVAVKATERDQEDAIEIQEEAVQRGLMAASTIRHYTSDLEPSRNGVVQCFEKPRNVLSKKNLRYDAIEDDGFPLKRKCIRTNEVVIGKTRTSRRGPAHSSGGGESATMMGGCGGGGGGSGGGCSSGTGSTTSARFLSVPKRCISQVTRQTGAVTEVDIQQTPFSTRGRVAVRTTHHCEIGDKATTDKGQKGVFSRRSPMVDMIFDEQTGMVPEIVVSPIGEVSRMTMASKEEGLVAKAVAESGEVDALGLDPHDYCNKTHKRKRLEDSGNILVQAGWQRNGSQWYRCGKTGKRGLYPTFTGIIKYERLLHLASQKLHYCAEGPRCHLTRQPRQGKRHKGGMRFGELEQAAALAQGAASCIQSRFRDLSDPFEIFICSQCKMLADGNKIANYAWCHICQKRDTVYIAKVPFTFLLNLYELMAMGVKMGLVIRPTKPPLLGLTYNKQT